jgi:uncharacterized protein
MKCIRVYSPSASIYNGECYNEIHKYNQGGVQLDLQKLRELAFKHMGNRKAHREREKGFIYYHGQRVANIALTLRKLILPEDDSRDDLLAAAAYFHDIAKGIEPHGQYGAVLAVDLLKEYCTQDELSEITEMIRCHQLRDDAAAYPDHIKILQDADILDHFGTIEVWMNFQYYAFTDEPVSESVKFYKDEFPQHIKEVWQMLNYEVSKRIYKEKVNFINSFTDRFYVEAEGGIYNLDEVK